jgi:hypothetical protein
MNIFRIEIEKQNKKESVHNLKEYNNRRYN